MAVAAAAAAASQDGMIVLLTITVDSRGARVTFIRYVPIWVRHPDFVVLPAGTAWRTDPAGAAALRASYERTVTVAGRGPLIQASPAHLLSAAKRPPCSAARQLDGDLAGAHFHALHLPR